MIHFIPSDICTAFQTSNVIGSKVTYPLGFSRVLRAAIAEHDFSTDRVPGQAVITITKGLNNVSSGVGIAVNDPSAYVLRSYRGKVSAFLQRRFAAEVTSCGAVVYTREAYMEDPDVTPEEMARVAVEHLTQPVTHVVVAVLASSGESQLSPRRFVANLAGGNREALVWSADEIRERAKAVIIHDSHWVTVAD